METVPFFNWAVARLPLWQGRVIELRPAVREAITAMTYRTYLERLLAAYPEGTRVAERDRAARGEAIRFLVNYYLEFLAHERIKAVFLATVAHLQRRRASCSGYEVALGAISFLYQQDQGWRAPSVTRTCHELNLPMPGPDHRKHSDYVAALLILSYRRAQRPRAWSYGRKVVKHEGLQAAGVSGGRALP